MLFRAIRLGTCAAVASAAAVALLVVPGGASVQRALAEADCAAILSVGENFPDDETLDQLKSSDLKAAAKGFASGAKQVSNTQVKKALKNIANTLKKAANAGSTAGAAKSLANRGYISAIKVWTTQAANCEISRAPQ